ncbi:MAG: hypothetical protein WC725_01095 [Patescibacteria group bacterium]|jgi:hypothetical protein
MFEYGNKKAQKKILGSYRMDLISLPEECDMEQYVPIELVYIFRRFPQYKERIRQLLKDGKAIGVRTMTRTPENVLKAVHTISVFSQENYIITWLPKLLREKHRPIVTESDRQRAHVHGENIDEAVKTILNDHLRFKRLVLVDEDNNGIKPEDQQFMTELSEIIYPLQIDYAIYRVLVDNAHERTEIAQSIIKALFIIGPVAHILEKYAAGIGKIFAASTDDLLGEAAELSALRGSGFSWKELIRRSRILIPVFALASWGAFSVHHLLVNGQMILGGVVFGFSAVALSLTTAFQSLLMYRRNLRKLKIENKLSFDQKDESEIRIALRQDFTNPARLGLIIGASLAPVMGITGALLGIMDNGWALATIGSTESIVAGLTVISAGRINSWRFERKMRLLAYQAHE